MAEQTELSFVLGWDEPDSVIADFIRCVGNGSLVRYKTIFQTGAKHGEPLYSHVLSMVFTAERLRPLLNLADIETRVLYSAIPPHDLNKVAQEPKVSFNRLATLKTVRGELERLNIPGFFPDYLDYLEDITLLIRSHSGHFHTDGEFLIPAHNPYRLDRDRLDHVLRPLIRALDNLQLSSTLTERTNKQDFLSFLNGITDRQYEFGHHHIAENRGILTNLIHNQVANYFEEQYGFIPLLFYPDGVAYLVEKGQTPRITAADLAEIGNRVASVCARIFRGDFTKFIDSKRPAGIKVNRQCLELGTSFADIWDYVHTLVMRKVSGKRFRIEEMEHKARENVQKELKNLGDAPLRLATEERLKTALFPSSQAAMGAGELLRSYYIFLSDHLKKQVGDIWNYLYRWLGINDKGVAFYNLLDSRYHRAYVVAGDLGLSIEALHERIAEDGQRLVGSERQKSSEALGNFDALSDYVPCVTAFSFEAEQEINFVSALQAYVTNNHFQCCHCGSEFRTEKWMKQHVPDDVVVQTFSNRLPGAWANEPKRNVCAICCAQFILEKLNRQSGKGIKTFYLHLFPYTFHTDVFFRALWDEVSELLATDTGVVFLRSDDALREAGLNQSVPLRLLTRTKEGKPHAFGLALPQHSELMGNVLIFPLNCPGENDAEQFLFALQNALVVQRFFGCKALLSLSPVPSISRDNFNDLFVDGVPLGFEGLLSHPDMNRSELENLWTHMAALARLRTELYHPEGKQNVTLVLIRAMANPSGLAVFYEADRLVEAKAGSGGAHGEQRMWQAIAITRRILSDVNILAKGGIMQALQELAEMAWRDRILGRSLERNSRLKPFDMILEALTGKSDAFGLDTVKAALVEDIFRHLEVIARPGYEPGRPKREKVKAYVDWFFKSILDEVYRGNVNRLLNDEKGLRSAYLFYFTEQIPMKEHAEAASTVQSTN